MSLSTDLSILIKSLQTSIGAVQISCDNAKSLSKHRGHTTAAKRALGKLETILDKLDNITNEMRELHDATKEYAPDADLQVTSETA